MTLRAAIWVAAIAFMQAGPALRTGLGVSPLPAGLHAWRMYHHRGTDQCKLVVATWAPGRDPEPVAWHRLLGHDRLDQAPSRLRFVHEHADAVRIGLAVCAAVPQGHGVSVVSTCSRRGQWLAPSDTAAVNVCAPRDALPRRLGPR